MEKTSSFPVLPVAAPSATPVRLLARVWALCALLALAFSPLPSPAQFALPDMGDYEPDYDTISTVGQGLFNTLAPEDVKAEYEFADADTLRGQMQGLMDAFAGEDLGELSNWASVAGPMVLALRQLPGGAGNDWASWLEGRLDYLAVAKELAPFTQGWSAPAPRRDPHTGKPLPQPPPARPSPQSPQAQPQPAPRAVPPAAARAVTEQATQSFMKKLSSTPPAHAASLTGICKRIFAQAGLPEELVWQAEVESSWNPAARSPAGAVGLYQFMAPSAQENGLSTSPVDQRLDAALCAAAAARYLKRLHGQFGNWPLALAAYNTGPGRVRKLLRDAPEQTFDAIVPRLSAETKLYVPKIDALVRLREGRSLADLPPPK